MPGSGETIGYNAFLDQVADRLGKSPTGLENFNFSEKEFKSLMDRVILSLLETPQAKAQNLKATVDAVIKFGPDSGTVMAKAKITDPVPGELSINCKLENDPSRPGSLKLAAPAEVRQEGMRLAGALMLKGIDPAALANEKLADPVMALSQFLKNELSTRGLKLTGVKMAFGKDSNGVIRLKTVLRAQKA